MKTKKPNTVLSSLDHYSFFQNIQLVMQIVLFLKTSTDMLIQGGKKKTIKSICMDINEVNWNTWQPLEFH